eukprot:6400993-Alexandrium_andersonii.AAC.1
MCLISPNFPAQGSAAPSCNAAMPRVMQSLMPARLCRCCSRHCQMLQFSLFHDVFEAFSSVHLLS